MKATKLILSCLTLSLVLAGGASCNVTKNQSEFELPPDSSNGVKPNGKKSGGTPPSQPGKGESKGGFGGSSNSSNIVYSGAEEITSSQNQTGMSYSSSTVDQSALLISTGDSVSISNPSVTKSGSSSGGDSCSFYGLNAAVLVKGGSSTTITGGSISSDASGANAVFCYGGNGGKNGGSGNGTRVIIRDTTITTSGSGSGGIMTTGGGITEAYNLKITTSGGSSAPIRTDRGGGSVTVDGGTYTSNGLGSPVIYSTADIKVSNSELISNLSEGVCIEGKNSITLNDCNLTANNTKRNGKAQFLDSVMIYQSMSGDADSGTSTFTMNGGVLTSKSGHIFHVTNTNAVINLNAVKLVNLGSDVLLSVCDDGWSGAGNTATLNAEGQVMMGRILVGSNSIFTMNLTGGSSFIGSIGGKITNDAGKTVSDSVGKVSVNLEEGSRWTLTEDTYITSFTGDASGIDFNGHNLYVNGKNME